jgi:hypothetical protein
MGRLANVRLVDLPARILTPSLRCPHGFWICSPRRAVPSTPN